MPYCDSCGVLNCYEVQIDGQCPLMAYYVLAYSFSFNGCFLNVKFKFFALVSMCNHSMQNFCMHRLHRCHISSNVQYTLGQTLRKGCDTPSRLSAICQWRAVGERLLQCVPYVSSSQHVESASGLASVKEICAQE